MRVLGINDKKDYSNSDREINRVSARCIVIEDGKIYLSHSKRYDFYKLPGGGVDRGESKKNAAVRETLEEAGVNIDKSTMQLYGVYIDKWKSVRRFEENSVWVNKSYIYTAKRMGEVVDIVPTESEIYDQVEAVLIDIDTAIKANEKRINHPEYSEKQRFLERENDVFRLIKKELM